MGAIGAPTFNCQFYIVTLEAFSKSLLQVCLQLLSQRLGVLAGL